MRIGDTLKAVGLAVAVLALNLLATTIVIVVYFKILGAEEPSRIAGWSAPTGGALLFLAAIASLGRRQAGRNPWTFAGRAWISYVILDGATGAAMAPMSSIFSWQMALSMSLALAGALGGAALARPPRRAVSA